MFIFVDLHKILNTLKALFTNRRPVILIIPTRNTEKSPGFLLYKPAKCEMQEKVF